MWIGGPATSLHSQGGGCSLPGRLLSASVGPQLGGRRRSWGSWVAHSPSMHLLQSKFSIATAVLGFSYMMSDGTLVLKIFWDWVISSMHYQKQLEALDCAVRRVQLSS